MSPLEAAIATRLPCFPCGALKRPTIPGPGGYKHATSDPAELRALWRRYPGALVGVRTGTASSLSVLDIDGVKHPEAEIWLAANRERLPSTRIHQTRSGGLHLVFQHVPGVWNSQGRKGHPAKGVDTRGEGGYAVGWPTAGFPVICDAPPAPWPRWLIDALFPPIRIAARITPVTMASDVQILERLARRVIHTPESQRNSVLFWAACRVGEAIRSEKIDERCGFAVLSGAALRAGLPASEAKGTIASGIRTGSRSHRGNERVNGRVEERGTAPVSQHETISDMATWDVDRLRVRAAQRCQAIRYVGHCAPQDHCPPARPAMIAVPIGFFAILTEWSRVEIPIPANDRTKPATSECRRSAR